MFNFSISFSSDLFHVLFGRPSCLSDPDESTLKTA